MKKNIILILILCAVGAMGGNRAMFNNNELLQSDEQTQSEKDIKEVRVPLDTSNIQSPKDSMELFDSKLCRVGEELIYSFKIVDSDDILTIATSEVEDYIVCRYGSESNLIIDFPQKKDDSWEQFVYAFYFRGGEKGNLGLDLNHFLFETDTIKYKVYYEYDSLKESISAGITLLDKKADMEIDLKADENSIIGSLNTLRDRSKININTL